MSDDLETMTAIELRRRGVTRIIFDRRSRALLRLLALLMAPAEFGKGIAATDQPSQLGEWITNRLARTRWRAGPSIGVRAPVGSIRLVVRHA